MPEENKLLPPIIAGGSGLLGSIVGSISGAIQARKARKWALEDWNRQNAYNHPSAQMSRLREAGLNPNMIYGTGTQAATGQATRGANVGNFQPPPLPLGEGIAQAGQQGLGAYYDVQVKEAQLDNLRTQNTLIANQAILAFNKSLESLSNIDYKKAGSESLRWLTARSQGMYGTQLEVLQENLRKLAAQTGLIGEQTNLAGSQNRYVMEQTDYLIHKDIREDRYLDSQLRSMQVQRNVSQQRIENMVLDYVGMKTRHQLTEQQRQNLVSQMNSEEIRRDILKIQRSLMGFQDQTKELNFAKDMLGDIISKLIPLPGKGAAPVRGQGPLRGGYKKP